MVNRTKELRTRGNIVSSRRGRRDTRRKSTQSRPFTIGEIVDYKGDDFFVCSARIGSRQLEYDIINEDDVICDIRHDELESVEKSSARNIKETRSLNSEKF